MPEYETRESVALLGEMEYVNLLFTRLGNDY
jgi:hypothetical protein